MVSHYLSEVFFLGYLCQSNNSIQRVSSTCTGTQSVYPYDFKGILQGKTLFSALNRVTQLYYHKKTAFVASFYETCLFFGIISSLSGVPSLKVSLKAVKSFMDFNSGRLYQLFEEWEVC